MSATEHDGATKMYVEYSSNNSGGHWWMDDQDWKDLEAAGWIVEWAHLKNVYAEDDRDYMRDENGIPKMVHITEGKKSALDCFSKPDKDGVYRYLGALAKRAYKPNCSDLRAAAEEWERVTRQTATDAGCACCGQPHTFTLYDDKGQYINSGPETSYEARW